MPTPSRKKLQIFISSTYLDLKEERQAAVAAILKAGHIPAGMELFTAGDQSQWETITKWIDECDIYILILGGRYGSIHPKTELSYTESEYNYAIKAKKPYFAVVIEEPALEAKLKTHGSSVIERDNPSKLKLFRENVLSKASAFFSDLKDIRLAIHETVPNLETKYPLRGWISGDNFVDTGPLAEEISRLSKENQQLRNEIEALRDKGQNTPNTQGNADLIELDYILTNNETSIPAIFKREAKKYNHKNLRNILYSFRQELLSGVMADDYSDYNMHIIAKEFPKLELYSLLDREMVFHVSKYAATMGLESERHAKYTLSQLGKRYITYIDSLLAKKAKPLDHKKKS